jgi:2-polyprenyl-3-methyl-5-hydroxy-6-metoxy-1,4-benzoquinol methylase
MSKIIINRLTIKLAQVIINKLLYNEHKSKINTSYIYERPIEYAFALEKLRERKALDVLDVGTGTNSFADALKHSGFNVTASDKKEGYWLGYFNRHIYVVEDDITKSKFETNSFDAVTCISVIEHIVNYNQAIGNMARIVRPGGSIILTFPYTWDTFCENIYQLDDADDLSKKFKYIARSYNDDIIDSWVSQNTLSIIEVKMFKGWTGKYWRTGRRIPFPTIVSNKENANIYLSIL